ncbi:MAG: hypothetical protein IKR89_03935 [Bacteroidaceae bacterium]|nr:hypothetical protein [Bacteroidaceae bacterium]
MAYINVQSELKHQMKELIYTFFLKKNFNLKNISIFYVYLHQILKDETETFKYVKDDYRRKEFNVQVAIQATCGWILIFKK